MGNWNITIFVRSYLDPKLSPFPSYSFSFVPSSSGNFNPRFHRNNRRSRNRRQSRNHHRIHLRPNTILVHSSGSTWDWRQGCLKLEGGGSLSFLWGWIYLVSHTSATTLHARKLRPEESTTVLCNPETCLSGLVNDTTYQINSVLITLKRPLKHKKVLNVGPNTAKYGQIRKSRSLGVSLNRSCKMQLRRVDPVSIGPHSQKLWPNLTFVRLPHWYYYVKLQSGGPDGY